MKAGKQSRVPLPANLQHFETAVAEGCLHERVPLPANLQHFETEAPLHLGAADVAALVEHWGFTRDGKGFVRKLVRCEVLKPRKFRFQRGLRFETEKVFGYYRREMGG